MDRPNSWLIHKFAEITRDRRGVVAVMSGLSITILIGFAALAIDVGMWMSDKQSLQNAADQAAYSAMIGASAGADGFTNAQAILSKAGYGCSSATNPSSGTLTCSGANGLTVNINNPPTIGSYQGNTAAWEVILTKTETRFFSNIVLKSAPVVSGRSVAAMGGDVCFLALDTRASDKHSFFAGTYADVTVENCLIANNLLTKSVTDSIDVKSGAYVHVSGIYMRTDTICDGGKCNGTLLSDTTPLANQPAIVDPYASRSIPVPGSCDYTNLVVIGQATLSPGTYCGTNGQAALTIAAYLTLKTSTKPAAAGTSVLQFTSTTGVQVGMKVTDTTHTAAIPSGTTVTAVNGNTVQISSTVYGGGSGLNSNDIIKFSTTGPATVTLSPGVYILDGKGGGTCTGTVKPTTCFSGDLNISGGASVAGTNVSIVLTTSTGTGINVGNLYVTDESALAVNAPTTTDYGAGVKGVAIWQNPLAPNPTSDDPNHYATVEDGVNYITSGASTEINGVVYFPSQALSFSGGSGTAACTQVVAFVILYNSQAEVNYPKNCQATAGVASIGSTAKLVE